MEVETIKKSQRVTTLDIENLVNKSEEIRKSQDSLVKEELRKEIKDFQDNQRHNISKVR